MAKSYWFKKLEEDLPKISSQLRMRPATLGFHRIYFKQAYVHEVFEEMTEVGYDYEGYDPRIENQSYYEEYEDNPELVRKIKNFIEGYRDSRDRILRRVWMMRHDNEFYETAVNAYKQMELK